MQVAPFPKSKQRCQSSLQAGKFLLNISFINDTVICSFRPAPSHISKTDGHIVEFETQLAHCVDGIS